MRIHIHTLGCKVNQFESQAMAAMLAGRGFEVTEEETGLDAVIINTCAVTAESVRKSRQAVRRLRAQNPGALVGICGCWSQAEAGEAAELGDLVFGSDHREAFIDALTQRLSGGDGPGVEVDDAFSRRDFEVLPAGSAMSRTRALLKIEDGCVNFCAYCIIPYTRGRIRSLPLESCAAQARDLAQRGYREIVLTGIEIASYGTDLPGKPTLADAAEAVALAATGCRIRLGSLEPRVVTEDFCQKLSALPNICPHFHLSLQSGCDATLARMRRRYDTARFYESVELLRKYFDDPGLTADLITGFAGETEEEFGATLDFIKKCGFSSMHVFPYSVRRGTAAENMDGQVEKSVKQDRAHRASRLAAIMRDEYLSRQVGRVLPVLFEQEQEGVWSGHAGNYCEVRAPGRELHNAVVNVQITAARGGALWGNVLL